MSFAAARRRFPALEARPFRFVLGALAISTFGDWLYNIVLLAWIYDRTGSGAWVAAASIARIAPVILFSLSAGDVADRYDRRRVMIVSDALRAAAMFALAVVAATGGPPLLAVVLVFATSTFGTPFLPAVDAVLPSLVGRDQLASANASVTVVQYLSLAAGPALGGLVALLGSASLVFTINAFTFVASGLLIATLRPFHDRDEPSSLSPLQRVGEGLRTIRSSRRLLALVACLPLTSFIPGASFVLLVLLSERALGLDAEGAAFLYAAIGVGAIVTSWFSDRLASGPPWLVLILSNSAMGIAFALLGSAEDLVLAYVFCGVIGAGTLIGDVAAFTLLQKTIPQQYLGRVFGVVNALLYLGMAAGSLVAAYLERAIGMDATLLVIGIVVAVSISALALTLRGWEYPVAAPAQHAEAEV